MNIPNDPPENPYAAPQAEIVTTKRRTVHARKFNGKLVFRSGSAISVVLTMISMFAVSTSTQELTTEDYTRGISVIIVFSFGMGLIIGVFSETLLQAQQPDSLNEESPADELLR